MQPWHTDNRLGGTGNAYADSGSRTYACTIQQSSDMAPQLGLGVLPKRRTRSYHCGLAYSFLSWTILRRVRVS
jgi:hypothetical protein